MGLEMVRPRKTPFLSQRLPKWLPAYAIPKQVMSDPRPSIRWTNGAERRVFAVCTEWRPHLTGASKDPAMGGRWSVPREKNQQSQYKAIALSFDWLKNDSKIDLWPGFVVDTSVKTLIYS